jgi:peptidoglycan/LPS O-acetylase OafA/YrhL
VDGLRGLAVLAVFFNHTLQWPSGGHLGVDMFFALSGFLITSQLLTELDQTGRVDLANFYWRRCKRLLPAFAVMCALYAVMTMCFPQQVAHASAGTLAGLLLVANIYWADGGHVLPFLNHTWSLAVEWQFYLVWPLLLVLMFRLGVKRRLLVVLMVLCVLWMCYARWRGNQLMHYSGILLGALVTHGQLKSKGAPDVR